MKRWLWTAALVSCAFIAMAQLPRPDTMLPASKVSTAGLPSTDLQTNISAGELCQAPCASGSLADNAVTEPKLKAIDTPTVGECLQYTTASGGDFQWASCGSGGVSDGDKTDITVSGSGATWLVNPNAVTLGTDTTGGYAGSATEGGAATSVVANSVALGGDTTGGYAASATEGGAASSVAVNSVALGTDTTGNYAGSSSEGGAATTATALAADPANCAAGNYPLGVDATGAVQSCTSAAGTGTVTNVGTDCDGPACFTGTEGTKLQSTTGEVLDLATDAALIYRNGATTGAVTITGADTLGASDTIFDTTGAGTITVGSADVTSLTIITDGGTSVFDGYTESTEAAAPGTPAAGKVRLYAKTGTPGEFCSKDDAGVETCMSAGSGGGGGITSVGDCTTGSCFTPGGTASTYLASDTNFSVYLDQTAPNAANVFSIYNGSDVEIFQVDESGNALTAASFLVVGDTAETGQLRLKNTDSICWENSDGVSAEFCLAGNASEQITTTGGLFDLARVGNPTQGKFSSDGTDWFWDVGSTPNGTHELGEPWVIGKGCVSTNDLGTVNCEENVNVAGDITVAGVTHMHERILYDFTTAAASIPDTDDCWALRGDYNSVIDASAADPANRCRQPLPYAVRVTRICASYVTGTLPTGGNCVVDFYTRGERATPMASFDISTGTAGVLDAVGDTTCVTVGADVAIPESFYAQANTTAGSCDATGNWPEIYFEVLGYGIN